MLVEGLGAGLKSLLRSLTADTTSLNILPPLVVTSALVSIIPYMGTPQSKLWLSDVYLLSLEPVAVSFHLNTRVRHTVLQRIF